MNVYISAITDKRDHIPQKNSRSLSVISISSTMIFSLNSTVIQMDEALVATFQAKFNLTNCIIKL